jgi:predicted AAA+ superfamily ATPase
MFRRRLTLPAPGTETFFLWGPRQSGKSTLLKSTYPDAFYVDLLRSEQFRAYVERPQLLRERIEQSKVSFAIIDEVQKVPGLLDEAHWLHENRGVRFALCGSSARKVKRGQANLLGGRAVRYELFGLTSAELADAFDLDRLLNTGCLPGIIGAARPSRLLQAYVADYLQQEVAAEGLVRRLPAFSEFLTVAALADTEMINMANVARECGVSRPTVKGYYEILVDTLLGRWLPAYRKRPKRRVIGTSKFYFADVGVVNALAGRRGLNARTDLYGKALESWLHHELSAFNVYEERFAKLSYWRLASGVEVDFLIDDARVAIEVKASSRIHDRHLTGLRKLKEDQPQVQRRLVVSLEDCPRRTHDGIEILSVRDFVDQLWSGGIF